MRIGKFDLFKNLLFVLATIYAFNTNINESIAAEASRKRIPIRTFNVIYHMLNDIKDELTKRIPATEEDVQTGSADPCV